MARLACDIGARGARTADDGVVGAGERTLFMVYNAVTPSEGGTAGSSGGGIAGELTGEGSGEGGGEGGGDDGGEGGGDGGGKGGDGVRLRRHALANSNASTAARQVDTKAATSARGGTLSSCTGELHGRGWCFRKRRSG